MLGFSSVSEFPLSTIPDSQQAATILSWLPRYQAEVTSPANAAQFSTVAQKILPQPIAQTDWYAFYPSEVTPPRNAAQFTFVAQKIQPSPINRIDWLPVYDSQVKPTQARAQHTYFSQLLKTPISINRWYPSYAAEITAPVKNDRFSYFSELLQTPTSLNSFYPSYSAEVAKQPQGNYSFVTPPIPAIAQQFTSIGWYPSYSADVIRLAGAPIARSSGPIQTIASTFSPIAWYPAYPDNVRNLSTPAFGMVVGPQTIIITPSAPIIAGKPRGDKQRKRARLHALADRFAQEYERAHQQESAEELLAPVVRSYTRETAVSDIFLLPETKIVDFEAMAASASARKEFIAAMRQVVAMRAEEEEFAIMFLASVI